MRVGEGQRPRGGKDGGKGSRQIPRGCACWRCRHKKTKCDGMRPCRRCIIQMAADDCRDYYLWEPYDDKLPPDPQWAKPTPLRFQKSHQAVKTLDKITRMVISEWVNFGELESDTAFEAASHSRFRRNAECLRLSLSDHEITDVMECAQTFIANVNEGQARFRSPGEHSVGVSTLVAATISQPYLHQYDWRSPRIAAVLARVRQDEDDNDGDRERHRRASQDSVDANASAQQIQAVATSMVTVDHGAEGCLSAAMGDAAAEEAKERLMDADDDVMPSVLAIAASPSVRQPTVDSDPVPPTS